MTSPIEHVYCGDLVEELTINGVAVESFTTVGYDSAGRTFSVPAESDAIEDLYLISVTVSLPDYADVHTSAHQISLVIENPCKSAVLELPSTPLFSDYTMTLTDPTYEFEWTVA